MTQLQLITPPRLRFKPSAYHRARVIRAWWWSVEPVDADEYGEFRADKQMRELQPAEFKRLSRKYGVN